MKKSQILLYHIRVLSANIEKANREKVKLRIADLFPEPDPDLMLDMLKAKEHQINALTAWLETQDDNIPDECRPLTEWLRRNPNIAYSAYNPYFMMVAYQVALALDKEVLKQTAETSLEMAKTLKWWRENAKEIDS